MMAAYLPRLRFRPVETEGGCHISPTSSTSGRTIFSPLIHRGSNKRRLLLASRYNWTALARSVSPASTGTWAVGSLTGGLYGIIWISLFLFPFSSLRGRQSQLTSTLLACAWILFFFFSFFFFPSSSIPDTSNSASLLVQLIRPWMVIMPFLGCKRQIA